MDRKLIQAYTDKILLEGKNEAKQHSLRAKKPSGVVKKLPEDAIGGDKAHKFTSKSGPEHVKGLHTPKKKAEKAEKAEKTEESYQWDSKFARIFNRVINENEEFQGSAEDESVTDTGADTDSTEPSVPELEGGEGGEDVVADLQDVVSKLQDILSALGGGEEEETEQQDGSEEFNEESPVNNDIDEIESGSSEVKESLGDIKSALSGLKSKISQLTGKANNKVKGALSKPSSGKATAGDSVDLEPLKHSDLHSKNSYKVDTKLKTGASLFEKRKS
jgi:hypothetical protein